MSQSDFGVIDPNTKSGTQLAVDLNGFRDAVNSGHSGSTRPAYLPAGGHWVRVVSSTQWDLVFYDGSADYTLRSINPTTGQKIGIPAADLALGTAATATLTTSATDGTDGRVMKVGDFGLGGAAVSILEANMNNADIATGFYAVVVDASGFAPVQTNGYMLYIDNLSANFAKRTYTAVTTGRIYEQVKVNGSWTAWQEIALTNSPAFTGTPTAPTAAVGTNTTQLANTAFVKTAVDAAPMIGQGQTWQNVTGSRSAATTYTNTTGRPIQVSVLTSTATPVITVNGVAIGAGSGTLPTVIVSNGHTYALTTGALISWLELR